MFWEFARVLKEMGKRRPSVIMLENVPGFATSQGGRDLRDAIARLNELGYTCDVLAVNASHFVPQSRLRMFIIGKLGGYVEFFSVVSSAGSVDWQGQFDVGFTYAVNDNLQLDTGCNFGVTESAPDFNPFIGLSWRF